MADKKLSLENIDLIVNSDETADRIAKSYGQEGLEYWQGIAPVNENFHPHQLPGGEDDVPGEYKDSLKVSVVDSGKQKAVRLGSTSSLAPLLEHGTKYMPKGSYLQKTKSHLEAKGAESQ